MMSGSISRFELTNETREMDLTMAAVQASQQEEMSWATLDIYLLLKILCRIPLNDLSWNVSFVCLSWQKACCELLFWNQNKLDLRIASPTCSRCNMFGAKTSNLFNLGLSRGLSLPQDDAMMDAKLMGLLRGIMEPDVTDWQSSIYSIYVPCDLQLSDRHLIYIAERTPYAGVLVIEKAIKITPDGLSKALSHWRHLGDIAVELIQYDLFEEMKEAIMASRGQFYAVQLNSTAANSNGPTERKYYRTW